MLNFTVIWSVLKRNVQSYFSGVLGYLVIVLFVTIAAFCAFSPKFFANNLASLDQLSNVFPILLLAMVPAITMGVWAEERKLGTDEILFTLPASDVEILLGKYLSVLTIYTVALAFSVTQLFALAWIGDPDWGIVFTTYLGYWLAGAALLSAGMFASVLTNNTTVAYVLGVTFCAIPVLVGSLAPGSVFIQSLSLSAQLRDFSNGMIPLSGLLYFLALTVFMLYLNIVFISRRHWSSGEKASMGLHFTFRAVALAACLISLNAVANDTSVFFVSRIDATAERLHTLSPTTINTIDTAKEKEREITIIGYLSPEVPQQYVHTRKQLVALLRQYSRIGGTTIDVQLVSVKPNSKEARNARNDGVEPVRQNSEVAGKQVEQDVYLGVVMKSDAGEIVVPFLDGETALEYELTRALDTVTNRPKRLKIGILETDALRFEPPQRGQPTRDFYQRTIAELEKQYKLVNVSSTQLADYLPKDKKIDTNVDASKADGNERDGDCDDSGDESSDDVDAPSGEADGNASTETDVATDDESSKEEESTDASEDDDPPKENEDNEDNEEDNKDRAPDVLIVVQPSSLTKEVMDDLVEYMELGNPVLLLDDPLTFFPFVWFGPEDIGIVDAPAQDRPSPQSSLNWVSAAPERPTTELTNFMTAEQQRIQQQFASIPPQFQAQMQPRIQQQLQQAYVSYLERHPEDGPRFEAKTQPSHVEMEILEVLWDKGPSKLQAIHDAFIKRQGEKFDQSYTREVVLVMRSKGLVTGDTLGTSGPDDDSQTLFKAGISRSEAKSKLMTTLGLEWNYGRVVTDVFDPHPEFTPEAHPRLGTDWPKAYGKRDDLLVFVTPSNGADQAFSNNDPVASGLQKMLFFYPGTVRKADDSELSYSPLITTGPDSALIPWDELTYAEIERAGQFDHQTQQTKMVVIPRRSQWTTRPLRRLSANPNPQSEKASQVIAAHVKSKKENGINAVFVADIDFITDYYFMQQEKLDKTLDNMTFLYNAIEVLAGHDSLVALRSRRAKPRQLTAIQDEIDNYRRERAVEQRKIEMEISEQLDAAREELKEKRDEIGNQADSLSELIQKAGELGQAETSTQKKFNRKKKKLDEKLSLTIDELKEEEQAKISRRETTARIWAVVLPPLPALLLGAFVLSVRVVNERRRVVDTRRHV